MGWFSRLFSGSSPEEERVDEQKLEAWFRVQTSDHFKDKEERQDTLIRQFEDALKSMGTLIGRLESAELRNKKIPIRMVSFMEGNRENYLHQVRILKDSIPSFGPEFSKQFDAQLDIFAQKTQRNYAVLQEFFNDEVKAMALKIKELSQLAREISLGDPRFLAIENTLQKIAEIATLRNESIAVQETIASKDEEVRDLETRKNETQQELSEKKNSPSFEQVLNLKELTRNQEQAVKELENKILNVVSPFSKLIKKYEHSTTKYGKLLAAYNNDAVQAFVDDTRITVVDIIYEAAGKASELGFSKKEAEKISERAKNLKKEELHKLYESYVRLVQTIKHAEHDLAKIPVIDEIAQLNTDRDNLHDQTQLAQAHKKLLEQKLQKIDENALQLRTRIQEMVEKVLGKKLVIV